MLTNVSGCPENKFVLVEPPIGHERRLLLSAHQVTMNQMIEALNELGDIENLFYTTFIRYMTSELN